MADLHIDANITAPSVVNVPLVRADTLGMSTTFRVCFEVSLAIASAALGSMINASGPMPRSHWALLALSTGAAIAFFSIEMSWRRKALRGE